MPSPGSTPFPAAAVVLSGGRGSRLGGVDKAAVEVAGRRLLDRVLSSLDGVAHVVVAGPEQSGVRAVFVRENPPGGGPVAGIYAGLDGLADAGVRTGLVALAAVDMPFLDAGTWRRLAAAITGRDGAVLMDTDGYRQLCGVFELAALERVRPTGGTADRAVRRVLAGLDLAEVAAHGPEADDVDTPEDLTRARARG